MRRCRRQQPSRVKSFSHLDSERLTDHFWLFASLSTDNDRQPKEPVVNAKAFALLMNGKSRLQVVLCSTSAQHQTSSLSVELIRSLISALGDFAIIGIIPGDKNVFLQECDASQPLRAPLSISGPLLLTLPTGRLKSSAWRRSEWSHRETPLVLSKSLSSSK